MNLLWQCHQVRVGKRVHPLLSSQIWHLRSCVGLSLLSWWQKNQVNTELSALSSVAASLHGCMIFSLSRPKVEHRLHWSWVLIVHGLGNDQFCCALFGVQSSSYGTCTTVWWWWWLWWWIRLSLPCGPYKGSALVFITILYLDYSRALILLHWARQLTWSILFLNYNFLGRCKNNLDQVICESRLYTVAFKII